MEIVGVVAWLLVEVAFEHFVWRKEISFGTNRVLSCSSLDRYTLWRMILEDSDDVWMDTLLFFAGIFCVIRMESNIKYLSNESTS